MNWEFRPLRKNELDHELIWLCVGFAAFAGGYAWLRSGLPWPQCILLRVTHLPCPTCGATRCFLFLTHANIASAFFMSPLVFIGIIAAGIWAIYASVVVLLRLPRLRLRGITPTMARLCRIAIVVTVLANWLYVIVTLREK